MDLKEIIGEDTVVDIVAENALTYIFEKVDINPMKSQWGVDYTVGYCSCLLRQALEKEIDDKDVIQEILTEFGHRLKNRLNKKVSYIV